MSFTIEDTKAILIPQSEDFDRMFRVPFRKLNDGFTTLVWSQIESMHVGGSLTRKKLTGFFKEPSRDWIDLIVTKLGELVEFFNLLRVELCWDFY